MSISNLINKYYDIIILGRGPSLRNFKKKKNTIVISMNFSKTENITTDIMFKSNKLYSLKNSSNINLKNYSNYRNGSVYFGLLNILSYINSLKENKRIHLYGFDFRKYSEDDDIFKKKRIKNDRDSLQQIIDINTQKSVYNVIKKQFKHLKIKKIGPDFESDFKKVYQNKKNSLEIISEFTTNHQGDTERLVKLLDYSIQSKCKTIKFQRRDVENFYSKKELSRKYLTPISKNFFEYRKKLELTDDQIDIIKYYKKKYNLKVIFSALDVKSYEELKEEGFKYFKIPSTISHHKKFIQYLAKQKSALTYISTGMTDQKYLNFILKLFRKKKIVLMHAISSYPTKFEDINLNILKKYIELSKDNKNIIPGYSSHDIGNLASMLAVGMGAKVIEKHIKIGVTDWMHYDDTALDAKFELPSFIDDLHKIYLSLGDEKKRIYSFEHHKYKYIKK